MKPMLRQYRYYQMSFTKEGRMSVAFFVGLLAGTFFFNMWGKNYMEELLLYKGLLMGRYEAGALAGLSLCLYILSKRGKRFFLLLCMELTEFCVTGRMLYALYYGFCAGVCASSFVFQYGFVGAGYFLLFLFPHYAAYAIMWQVLNQTERFKKTYSRIFLTVVLFVIGVLLEGYIHAGLLQHLLSAIEA